MFRSVEAGNDLLFTVPRRRFTGSRKTITCTRQQDTHARGRSLKV